jgi:hypothetical protein
MNTEALFIFLILLLGLVLCSFLGGNSMKEALTGNFSGTINLNDTMPQSNSGASTGSGNQYDNYNHYTGTSSQLSNGSTFYGENGTTAKVVAGDNGSQTLQIILPGSSTPVTFSTTDASSSTVESYTNYGSVTTYYGPSGDTATIVNTENGQQAIKVTTSSGTYYYNVSGTPSITNTSTQYYGSTGDPVQQSSYSLAYQGPNGGSAGSVTGPQGNTAYYAQGPNGNTTTGTYSTNQYQGYNGGSAGSITGSQGNTAYYAQGPNGNTTAGTYSNNQYQGSNGGSAGSITGSQGNTAYYAQGPNGNTTAGTYSNDYYQYQGSNGGSAGSVTGPQGNTAYYAQGPNGNTASTIDYSSALPPGIPRSQIPPGQEDMYILKSEVVPPVCPACPTSSACPRQEPSPPCPACARCPEPSFECKKVPNYNAINNDYLPAPVLNDFSTFGM